MSAAPPRPPAPRPRGACRWSHTGRVDCVQSLELPGPLPADLDLPALERHYHLWASRLVAGAVGPTSLADGLVVVLWPARLPLLRLGPLQVAERRVWRQILGGSLGRPGGELAFEHGDGRLTVAVRGFSPRLPRRIYDATQRPLHERVTRAFLRWAARRAARALRGRPATKAAPAGARTGRLSPTTPPSRT